MNVNFDTNSLHPIINCNTDIANSWKGDCWNEISFMMRASDMFLGNGSHSLQQFNYPNVEWLILIEFCFIFIILLISAQRPIFRTVLLKWFCLRMKQYFSILQTCLQRSCSEDLYFIQGEHLTPELARYVTQILLRDYKWLRVLSLISNVKIICFLDIFEI